MEMRGTRSTLISLEAGRIDGEKMGSEEFRKSSVAFPKSQRRDGSTEPGYVGITISDSV
jgi:hypothetical protein